MLMVGHDSLESLDSCRLVCRSWNAMIVNKIRGNPTKQWGPIIRRRIGRSWDTKDYYPTDRLVARAKLLGEYRIQ